MAYDPLLNFSKKDKSSNISQGIMIFKSNNMRINIFISYISWNSTSFSWNALLLILLLKGIIVKLSSFIRACLPVCKMKFTSAWSFYVAWIVFRFFFSIKIHGSVIDFFFNFFFTLAKDMNHIEYSAEKSYRLLFGLKVLIVPMSCYSC